MSEDFVSFNIMRILQRNGWVIVQYHPPGGQASFGLNVSGEILYPDLIGYKDSMIVVLENKPSFDSGDVRKLRKIMQDASARNQIIKYVEDFCKDRSIGASGTLLLLWAHGFSARQPPNPLQDINLICVQDDGTIRVTQAILNPLII